MLPYVNYRDDPSAGGSYAEGDAGRDTYDVPLVEPEVIVAPYPDNEVQFVDIGGTSDPTGEHNGSATEPEEMIVIDDSFGTTRATLAGWSPSIDEALAFERTVTGEPAEGQLVPFGPTTLATDPSDGPA